jgi:thioredoxin 1
MSDAGDSSERDEVEAIRERKREQLKQQLSGDATETAAEEPVHVDGADHLSELVSDTDVVLVDFYADWCGPCKMLEPTVESIAANTAAAVAKVDVDANQDLAAQYGVRSVPTLVLFADGEAVEQVVGVKDESTLTELVGRYT